MNEYLQGGLLIGMAIGAVLAFAVMWAALKIDDIQRRAQTRRAIRDKHRMAGEFLAAVPRRRV